MHIHAAPNQELSLVFYGESRRQLRITNPEGCQAAKSGGSTLHHTCQGSNSIGWQLCIALYLGRSVGTWGVTALEIQPTQQLLNHLQGPLQNDWGFFRRAAARSTPGYTSQNYHGFTEAIPRPLVALRLGCG